VLEGTAKSLKNMHFTTAGKTGTAKISGNGGYEKGAYNSTFVGYFPADNPQYSCIVVVQRPSENGYYGGTVAGPVFKEIAAKVYSTSLAFKIDMPDTAEVKMPKPGKATAFSDLKTIVESLDIQNDNYLGEEEWARLEISEEKAAFVAVDFNKKYVPDLQGMKAKDAVYLAESLGLQTSINGKGKVRSQSLKAGTPLGKGDKINLKLSTY